MDVGKFWDKGFSLRARDLGVRVQGSAPRMGVLGGPFDLVSRVSKVGYGVYK